MLCFTAVLLPDCILSNSQVNVTFAPSSTCWDRGTFKNTGPVGSSSGTEKDRYTILYVHIQANVNIHVYVVYMYLTVGWNRDLILDFLNFLKTHLKLDGYKGENGYTELKHGLCDPLSF